MLGESNRTFNNLTSLSNCRKLASLKRETMSRSIARLVIFHGLYPLKGSSQEYGARVSVLLFV